MQSPAYRVPSAPGLPGVAANRTSLWKAVEDLGLAAAPDLYCESIDARALAFVSDGRLYYYELDEGLRRIPLASNALPINGITYDMGRFTAWSSGKPVEYVPYWWTIGRSSMR